MSSILQDALTGCACSRQTVFTWYIRDGLYSHEVCRVCGIMICQ